MKLTFANATAILAMATCLLTRSAAADEAIAPPLQTTPEIYLTDFDLDAADLTLNSGLRAGHRLGNLLPNSSRGLLERPLRFGTDPATRAREIVALMSQTLQADLQKAGANAHILPPGAATPTSGWLVRGVFLNAEEGNRLRRAVIGLKSGQAKLQVAVSVEALSATAAPKALYTITQSASSPPVPGAIITLNPYVAAAKFIIDGHDLNAEIKKTARKIAEQIVKQTH